MRFEKISYEQWKKDWDKHCAKMASDDPDVACKAAYEQIVIPKRSTKGSAGYDFVIPYAFIAHQNDTCTGRPFNSILLTGIRWVDAPDDNALFLFARSGIANKHNISLANSVGVIDSDYCNADNEGHIMFSIVNDPRYATAAFTAGTRIGQGVIMKYLTVDEDNASDERTGGFGSTGIN